MTDKRDYYDLLGVSRAASADDIKVAYRNLARKLHPDVNKEPEADTRFKEINEAYEVLKDDAKREMYDQFGHDGPNHASGPGGGPGSPFGGVEDIFEMFFGAGGGGRRVQERGDDLRQDIELTLEEAVQGVDRTLRYPRLEPCDVCRGSGAEPGTAPETCPVCAGVGHVRVTRNIIIGAFQSTAPCTRCRGQGRIIQKPCKHCTGNGRLRKTRERSVRIPAGVDSGTRIRLSGEGDVGLRGAGAGDLYVMLHVRPHAVFERRGNDLLCEVPISFARAALGGSIGVPVIGGEEQLDIPEGTQTGTSFRLANHGVPDVNGRQRGHQYVIVKVEVPTHLNGDQKRMLAEFARSLGEDEGVGAGKSLLDRFFRGDK